MRKSFTKIADEEVDWNLDTQSHALSFNEQAISCIQANCDDIFDRGTGDCTASVRSVLSGAGHDSAYTNRGADTAMIFVPCRERLISQSSRIRTQEDCSIRAAVLMNSILTYGSRRGT